MMEIRCHKCGELIEIVEEESEAARMVRDGTRFIHGLSCGPLPHGLMAELQRAWPTAINFYIAITDSENATGGGLPSFLIPEPVVPMPWLPTSPAPTSEKLEELKRGFEAAESTWLQAVDNGPPYLYSLIEQVDDFPRPPYRLTFDAARPDVADKGRDIEGYSWADDRDTDIIDGLLALAGITPDEYEWANNLVQYGCPPEQADKVWRIIDQCDRIADKITPEPLTPEELKEEYEEERAQIQQDYLDRIAALEARYARDLRDTANQETAPQDCTCGSVAGDSDACPKHGEGTAWRDLHW